MPLDKEWEAKVENALKNGHGKYTYRDLIKVVPPVGSNAISQWLNDETINGYLELIVSLGNQDSGEGTVPKFHAFNSFFMSNLLEKGYAGVMRWAKRAKIDGLKLKSVYEIYIPINRDNHWTLLVVSPRSKTIRYYDSLGGSGKQYIKAVIAWLKGELNSEYKDDEWDIEYSSQSPQQTNGYDCGVFAITTAKQLMLGRPAMSYSRADIPIQRKRIVAELIAGKLL